MPTRSRSARGAALGVVAEHGDDAARAGAVALEDLDGRRLAGAVGAEQAEDLAGGDLEVDAAHGLMVAVGLVQVADEDRWCGSAHRRWMMATVCAARASTSARTPPDCSSPSARAPSCGCSPPTAASCRWPAGPTASSPPPTCARWPTPWPPRSRRPARTGARGCASSPPRRSARPPTARRCARPWPSAAGAPVEVLSGGAGGRPSRSRARRQARTGDGPVGVIDVGGGSSELVCGTLGAGVAWWASIPLGSGALTARHLRSDPPAAAELDAVRADVAAALAPIRCPGPEHALAVGGSAMSLRRVAGEQLTAAAIAEALATLGELPAEVAALHFGVDPRRARLLPAGLRAAAGRLGRARRRPAAPRRGRSARGRSPARTCRSSSMSWG